MRSSFRREVGRESFGIRHAGQMRPFEDVLIVRLGRQEQRGSLGAHDRYRPRQLDSSRETPDQSSLPPSGSNGLMFGDILGRKAGLTCTEVFRFLGSRPPDLESVRLCDKALLGETALGMCGLEKTEFGASAGELIGSNR